jgi:hypothetical protein
MNTAACKTVRTARFSSRFSTTLRLTSLLLISLLCLALSACQRSDTSTNTNLATNTNSSPAIALASPTASPTPTSAAREPEKYRAVLVFSAETEGGQKTVGIPTLSVEVARNAADRRVSFKLPDGSDLIYLEQGGKHIVIAPARKQYAELTPEKLKGVERVGDDTINGRPADKYRYATTTNTSTSAGEVKSEAFFYVDKETGLPLRAQLESEASGNVQGVKGARVVAEMRDITTIIDDSLFQVPADFSKVPPEQVRQQIDSFTRTVMALGKLVLSNMNAPAPSPTASPAQ